VFGSVILNLWYVFMVRPAGPCTPCDDAMDSEDGDITMWEEGGENCVIRRFIIVLFTSGKRVEKTV